MKHATETFAPDFFVVGAAKAGTTALYNWLQDHPAIFLPAVKEPGFFAYADGAALPKCGPFDPNYFNQIAVDNESYSALYEKAGPRLTGDVSPVYLLNENAAERIAAARPDARIIIVLRDPVERAFSQYMHHVRDSLETCETFEQALAEESSRLAAGWSWGHGYATHGHYCAQIKRYLSVFPREQVLFLDFQDMQTEPEECWRQLCTHLSIEQRPLAQNERVNQTVGLTEISARPGITHRLRHPGKAQKLLKQILPWIVRAKIRQVIEGPGRPVPLLRMDTKRSLANRYQGERLRIKEMTGLSLTHWLTS
jgi:hypothetical protein